MIPLTQQYIKDTAGKQIVVPPAKQFNNLKKELEESEDIKRYDAAKKRKQNFVNCRFSF